jgi:predicted metalloprotease with PDZ domain
LSEPIAPVHYRIVPADPGGHLYRVWCTVAEPDPAGQVLSLPAWIPGSYMVRDFARNLVTLEAATDAGALAVEKLDKHTWRCSPAAGPLTVTCLVYAWDLSVRAAHLDTTHGYFNGTSVFLRPHGREEGPCTLDIEPGEHPACRDWRVATALPRDGAPEWGYGRYRAGDYDALVDHPVEMGHFTLVRFEAGGVPHALAVTGRARADWERLKGDLARVCETHIHLFGAAPPMDRYLFLLTVVGDGYGGLEHRASSSNLCSRRDLPVPGREQQGEGYRNLLGLLSHEYFHSWNVKRITPAAFRPYDLSREVHTTLLWAFEGITSYYDDLGLVRSGVIDVPAYLKLLGQTATRVQRGAGRHLQSVAESSFDAWTRFYKQDENAPNAIVSYYAKGALVALALDLTLRRETGGERCLDQLMGLLWERHGRTGIGVPEDGVEALAAEVAGRPLGDFFARYVWGTEDPPLADLLADVGVTWRLRPAASQEDKGGEPPEPGAAERAVLGARTAAAEGGAKVTHVFTGGAAHGAGIAAGDLLVAVDGLRVSAGDLEARLAEYPPGSTLVVHLFRRDELMALPVRLQAAPADTVWLEPTEADAAARARRRDWLGVEA